MTPAEEYDLKVQEFDVKQQRKEALADRRYPPEQVRKRKSYQWWQAKLKKFLENDKDRTPEQNLVLLFHELCMNGGFFTHRGALVRYKQESMEQVIIDYKEQEMEETKISSIMVVNDKEIKGFFRDYRWLSNFHVCEVHYEGQVYQSSEAAFQAAKSLDPVERRKFTVVTPSESKSMGRKVTLRPDWEANKDQIMYDILKDKFSRNLGLKQQLLSTDGKYLEETNYWGDVYWGVCEGKGQNKLGKLLMIVRDDIKNGIL